MAAVASGPDPFVDLLNSLLTSVMIELTLFGVYSCLVLYSAIVFFKTKSLRRPDLVVTGATFLMYIMEFVGVVIYATRIRSAFVYNSTNGTDAIFASYVGAPHHLDLAATRDAMAVMSTFFADCILIWRVYAIWGSNWKVALFPALLTCLAFVFGILYIDVAHIPPQQVNQTWGANIGTIYYSSTLANTVISTILIISRVLFMAGKSGISRYRRILEAVVESAALYSIMLIIYVPFVSNPAPWTVPPTLMLQSVVIPITGIAPTLITLRILLNRHRALTSGNSTINELSGLGSSTGNGMRFAANPASSKGSQTLTGTQGFSMDVRKAEEKSIESA